MTSSPPQDTPPRLAIVGGGPAGLMAAQAALSHPAFQQAGGQVVLYDAMPSLGRKFLMAGKSGLNLTHGEEFERFLTRYGTAQSQLEPALTALTPQDLRNWASELGVETFVGSSGRVFPKEMKAAPLLRSWLHRLRALRLTTCVRHRWTGWSAEGQLSFETTEGHKTAEADATVLALGGKSWARLGSDGAWQPWLEARGVTVMPFQPANCGFDVTWSSFLQDRFAGDAVKAVRLSAGTKSLLGEFVISRTGLEGSAIYSLSQILRDQITETGSAKLTLDLHPDRSLERLVKDLSKPRGSRSFSNHLRRTVNFKGVKVALLRELCDPEDLESPRRLATAIKALPVTISAPRPLDEAISTAGGLSLAELTPDYMVRKHPGLFCAGEMLDWEAPTGGYLLTACFATGQLAGRGAADWLMQQRPPLGSG
ncbi:TIGR03862 family flavoprotein [Rhodovibrionaceae bacterium A322]